MRGSYVPQQTKAQISNTRLSRCLNIIRIPRNITEDDFEKVKMHFGEIMETIFSVAQKGNVMLTFYDVRECIKSKELFCNINPFGSFTSSEFGTESSRFCDTVLLVPKVRNFIVCINNVKNIMTGFGDVMLIHEKDKCFYVRFYDIRIPFIVVDSKSIAIDRVLFVPSFSSTFEEITENPSIQVGRICKDAVNQDFSYH